MMKFFLLMLGICSVTASYAQITAQTPVPTPGAPLQSVNNQILQINNNLATQQSSPTPNPTVNPVPANAPKNNP